MAIYNSISLGSARKSLGNVTLSSLKGQKVAKQKMTQYADAHTLPQITQRGKMKLVVMMFPYFAALLSGLKGFGRSVESSYNTFVRLFIGKFDDIDTTDVGVILSTVPAGNYGNGVPIAITSCITGATGLTLNLIASRDSYDVQDKVRVMLFDKKTKTSYSNTEIIGTEDRFSVLISDPDLDAADIAFVGLIATDSSNHAKSPLQIIKNIV